MTSAADTENQRNVAPFSWTWWSG